MAITTYSELKTAITDHLDRDDLSSQVDNFIDLAEARFKREIRIREMIEREALTIDERYESLPTGCLEIINLRLLTNPVTVLQELNIHEMNRVRSEGNGKPRRFSIHEQIEFDVTPDQSYSGEVIFYEELTALSDANTSNALLAKAPDAYLYASLLASAPFLLNDERIAIWGGLYKDAKDELNKQARGSRRVGPLISRVAGATP